MSRELVLLVEAADFAARKHVAQRRKSEAAEPYVNHLAEVAAMLAEATDGEDPVLVMGGLLHDTIEDTATTYQELAERFGEKVASLVQEVSDDKSLPKAERKRLQIEETPSKSRRARLLKIADKTSNVRALIQSPPKDWSIERLRDYALWAEAVVKSCRGLNPKLEEGFDEALRAAKQRFGA